MCIYMASFQLTPYTAAYESMRAFKSILSENDSAAQRREEKVLERAGKVFWKKVETKVNLDCLGKTERICTQSFKQKKKLP